MQLLLRTVNPFVGVIILDRIALAAGPQKHEWANGTVGTGIVKGLRLGCLITVEHKRVHSCREPVCSKRESESQGVVPRIMPAWFCKPPGQLSMRYKDSCDLCSIAWICFVWGTSFASA